MIITQPADAIHHRSSIAAVAIASLVIAIASGVASASVEAEIAYHEGVVAYGEGRLEDARRHFEVVLAADPGDESAIEYLALISEAEDRKEESLDQLRAAAEANPGDLDLQIAYGTALLKADRTAEAEAVFTRVLEADPEIADAQLYAGIAQYRRRDFKSAIEHLNRAVALDPGLRLQASYYTGLSEAFQGDLQSSLGNFEDTAGMSTTNPLSISAAELSRAIKPSSRPWDLEVMAGVEYDSNPALVGRAEDTFGSRKEDAVGVFGLRGRYRVYEKDALAFRVAYNGFFSVHDRNTDYDQQTHVLSGVTSYAYQKLRFGLRYDFANTMLDGTSQYRMQHRLTPSVNWDVGRFGISQLFYQFQDFDYDESDWTEHPTLNLDSNPNGQMHTLGVTQYIYLPRPLTYGRIGFAYDNVDTDGTEYEHDGVSVNVGFGAALLWGSHVDILYRYLYRDFDNTSVWPDNQGNPVKRDDNIHRVSLVWAIPIQDSLELSVNGALNFNRSDHPVFKANRHLAGIQLRYFF